MKTFFAHFVILLALSASPAAFGAPECLPPAGGMTSWWPGDGTANDIVGTNNGTLEGGATASAPGLVGPAFSFNGTNGYVQIPDSPAFHPANLTIEAWVRFSSLNSVGSGGSPAGDQYIVFKQNSQTYDFEGFDLGKTRLAGGDVFKFLVTSATAQTAQINSTTFVTTNVWYHVAAVRGSNFTQLYVNGQLQAQTNVSFAQNYGSLPLYFGTSGQTYWDRKFAGSLDEVSLYNRALASNEIAAIYAAGAAGKCKAASGPAITAQPQSQTVAVGSNVLFAVTAGGTPPLGYQWQFNTTAMPGATNATLMLANVQTTQAGNYTVIVTNSIAAVTSAVAVLTVTVSPAIVTQPASQSVVAGANASFSVTASGTAPLSYQWQFNGASITGASNISLTLANVQSIQAGNYTVIVANAAAAVTSMVAVLTVTGPPVILTQPASQSVVAGANASFSVAASGTAPLSYQWQFNGVAIPGAINSTLTLTNAQVIAAGSYTVVVTNQVAAMTSAVAVLNVVVPGSCLPPAGGMTSWWPGDGTANDIVGTNNGTLEGGATASAPGLVGPAFSFNGTNGYVQIPDSPAFHPANLTIEAWVRFSSLNSVGSGGSPAGDQYIVFKQNSQTYDFEGFDLGKTRLAGGDVFKFLVTSATAQTAQINSTTFVTTNVWYHVAAVRGSNFTQLYVNGQLQAQTNVSFAQNYGSLPLYFGTSGQTYWDRKFAGSLDEVSLYNRALASNEIAAIYAAGAAGKCKAASGPAITAQPQSQTVAVGSNVLFAVTAGGTPPLGYQWQFNTTAMPGATNTTLMLANVQTTQAGNYTVIVTNSIAAVTSAVAVLTVTVSPAIVTQPASQSVVAGANASFNVTASGVTPLVYQWLFNGAKLSGATGTSLSLTGVQPANAGSYAVVVTNSGGSVTSAAAVLTVVPAAGTVTINGAVTYQVIDGFGVNANSLSWNNTELEPVLDALINQAGLTLFQVIVENSNWEATNDNSDANVMNWAYYNSIYNSMDFQKMWGMMAYLNQQGITNGLIPKVGGPVALWMGGLSLKSGDEDEYAETVASMLVYARTNQHLQFHEVRAVNEPDITYSGVSMSGPAQYVTVMHDLGLLLDANGMSDVRFSGPDLAYATSATSWMNAIMGDSYLMSKMAHYGVHAYLNETPDASGIYSFIQQSAYPNTHFWMTEYNEWCPNCLYTTYGASGNNTWDYARDSAGYLLTLLGEGASAGVVFEAYDSQYYGYDSSTGLSTPVNWSYWGLLAVDDVNATPKTYTARKGFYTLAQIAKFVRPGAQRINVSGSVSPLTMLAFFNTNSGQLTLTGVNTTGSASSLSCALASLPAIPSLELYYTSSTTNLCDGGPVAVNNGAFSVVVPANCVFTLTYSNTSAPLAVSRPALTVAAPHFLKPSVQNGNVSLTLAGENGSACLIEASSDLAHWFAVTNVTILNGTVTITEPIGAGEHFYRAMLLP